MLKEKYKRRLQDLNDRLPISNTPNAAGYYFRRQPYYDVEFAKMSVWLKQHDLRCYVDIKGNVELRKKSDAI